MRVIQFLFISHGRDENRFYRDYMLQVETSSWVSSRHNMGMAMNKTVWNKIRKCAVNFCTYDDYNWDWSLQNVSTNCLKKEMEVMMCRGPRVFHIGECGFHHKKQNCQAMSVVSRVQTVLRSAKKYLFPKNLQLVTTSLVRKQTIKNGNGGWSDLRDQQLCLSMLKNT
ncbi:hypothetical protein RUM44_001268 [Polyplax serrata]|uniref:Alpha-1,6-mannosyl-glycoprotein 2-beta-N-acetylglucosaminyltransferase n=1 Tax=Polyplax serrata TaxID=468196 RepID=A0ABR1AJI1_POLSC